MKTLSVLLIALMIFASAPVFACGGGGGCGGDKDKADEAFTSDVQYLCDGGGEKTDPQAMCCSCGCKKEKPKPAPEHEPKPEPKPQPEPEA